MLDGEVIASRNRGLLTRLLGGGWPDPAAVIGAIRERLQPAKGTDGGPR